MQDLSKIPEAAAREEAERAVKKRVMGNMRLIAELYKWVLWGCGCFWRGAAGS